MNAHELAATLKNGQTVYDKHCVNADGTARRYRITSIKTWKRDQNRIRIGLKHGLYNTFAIESLDKWNQYITTVEPIYPKQSKAKK